MNGKRNEITFGSELCNDARSATYVEFNGKVPMNCEGTRQEEVVIYFKVVPELLRRGNGKSDGSQQLF